MPSYSLNASIAFLCEPRGLTTSNEIAEAITIRRRIISTIRSFPGFQLLLSN